MSQDNRKRVLRHKRKRRIRAKVSGTAERPRLSVFRSAKHVYVQVIDDECGKTLESLGTYNKAGSTRADISVCGEIGKKLAAACIAKNIKRVVFDKNGYAYHGRIKAIAEGAREGGLEF